MRHRPKLTIALSILLLVILSVGCSAKTQGQKTVKGFNDTREFLDGAQRQVDATIAIMNRLRATPVERLSDGYAQYKKAVDQLEKEGADAKWRAQGMKEKSDLHIKKWQEEMATITDPAIKASLVSRQEAVRSNYKVVRMYADDARKAYDPFLAGNKQMAKALSIDLSPASINSLSAAMDRVTADGVNLKQKLAAMQNALGNMSAGDSPLGQM